MNARAGKLIICALLALVAWFYLRLRFGYRTGEAISALTLGWFRFMVRNGADAAINWPGILMVGVCTLITTAILFYFLRRKHVLTVMAGFWLIFILSMASSGFFIKAHEVIFSDEPMLIRGRSEAFMDVRQELSKIRWAFMDSNDDLETFRRNIAGGADNPMRAAIFSGGHNRKIVALLIPQDQRVFAQRGFVVSGEDFAAIYPKEFLSEVSTALNQLATNSWDGNLRTFLTKKLSKAASNLRKEEEAFRID